jgi:hypothetical protein
MMTMTAPEPPEHGCHHWNGATRTWCGAQPVRRYLTGDRCDTHRPRST